MKMTLKKLSLIIAFGGLSLSAVAIGLSNNSSELFSLNEAEASCNESPINNGRCTFTDRCSPDPGGVNTCDSTLGDRDPVIQ